MPGAHKKVGERPTRNQQKPSEGRELLEFIGRELKTDIDLAEPIPERLKELIEQLIQRINKREIEPEEV
jgi:hypothetical protein